MFDILPHLNVFIVQRWCLLNFHSICEENFCAVIAQITDQSDYGEYICVASNARGKDNATIVLYRKASGVNTLFILMNL